MHGAGNDFIVIDAINQQINLTPAQWRQLADRRFGIGADQILVVEASEVADIDFRYRIFIFYMYSALSFWYKVIQHSGNFIKTTSWIISKINYDLSIAWIFCDSAKCLYECIFCTDSKRSNFNVLLSEFKFLIFYIINDDFCPNNCKVELY